MRACVVGAGSPALPALPAWSPAYPATCSSPAPVPFPPAHCPPAASTSTPTHPAGHPAPFQPLAMASQRRNVSLGIWGCRSPRAGGGAPGGHVWLGLVREGRVYRCSREPQGANITGPLGHLKPEEVGPPAPTQGPVITSSAPQLLCLVSLPAPFLNISLVT